MGSVNSNPMQEKYCCMIMRINVDCNACCRKLRRVILRMKEIETHLIEKQQRRVCVCGKFEPAEIAIKIKRKMKRRVEILEVQEFEGEAENNERMEKAEKIETTERTERPQIPMVVYPGQVPSHFPTINVA